MKMEKFPSGRSVSREEKRSNEEYSSLSDDCSSLDDEDLPCISPIIGSTSKKRRCLSITPTSSKLPDSYIEPKYKFKLDDILKERMRECDTNLEVKNMERELKEGFNVTGVKVLEENGLIVDKNNVETVGVIESQCPGKKLFDVEKKFCLYEKPPLPQIPKPSTTKFFNIIEELFSYYPNDELFIIEEIKPLAKELVSCPKILSFVLYLMASSKYSDYQLVSCNEFLEDVKQYVVRNAKHLWKPSVEDFLICLINFGADETLFFSAPNTLNLNYDDVKREISSGETQTSNIIAGAKFPAFKLSLLLKTMTSFIEPGFLYPDCDLQFLLFLSCILGIDKTVLRSTLVPEIQTMIDAIVESFSDNFWTTKIFHLVKYLLSHISDHHHDWVFIARLMPITDRGLQLQKLFSYLALSKIINIEVDECMTCLQPNHFLKLCSKSLFLSVDYYPLHAVVELIDLCVGTGLELSTMTQDTLKELMETLQEVASRVKGNAFHLYPIKVRNLIVQVTMRWTFVIDKLPSSQKSLFSYISKKNSELTTTHQNGFVNSDTDDDILR